MTPTKHHFHCACGYLRSIVQRGCTCPMCGFECGFGGHSAWRAILIDAPCRYIGHWLWLLRRMRQIETWLNR